MTSPVSLIYDIPIAIVCLNGLTSHRQQGAAKAATDRAAMTKQTAAKCRTAAAAC